MADTAFGYLCQNTRRDILDGVALEGYRLPFSIAALMHDCAHAVFSHSFEAWYDHSGRATKLLLGLANDAEFKLDYEERCTSGPSGLPNPPAAHEIFSAAMFLKFYGKAFSEGDPLLVARMITGVKHRSATTRKQQVENCLILLINSDAIDMDKLDYILRDTWASGVSNVSIDIVRLLRSVMLDEFDNHLVPCFSGSAQSVIQSVVDGRNHLYRWVYAHNTVRYYEYILQKAAKKLFDVLPPAQDGTTFVNAFFGERVFSETVECGGHRLYLPTDGDLWFLLKHHRADIPEVDEILSRSPRLVPLWKTSAEYEVIFADKLLDEQRLKIQHQVPKLLSPVLGTPVGPDDILVTSVKPNTKDIKPGDIFISIKGRVSSFTTAVPDYNVSNSQTKPFYYVFIPKAAAAKRDACIAALHDAPVY
ncbi:MAG: hypothetical protein NTW87_06420 [Planctomycetota bacterium]|nr:hypothetical protein [Planctomycetota bacterium]